MRRCTYCMRETDDSSICKYCGQDENKPANPRHLPPNTAIGDRYIVGRALNQTEDAIIYAALDQSTNERIRIYEYYPRKLARRDARTLEVAPVPGSEKAFADGLEALRARMEQLGCRLYEGNGSIYAAVDKQQAALIRSGVAAGAAGTAAGSSVASASDATPAPEYAAPDYSNGNSVNGEDYQDNEETDMDVNEDGEYVDSDEELLEEEDFEEEQQRRRNRIIMIAIGAACALLLAIGIWMLTRDSVDQKTDTLPTLLPQVTATATPMPSPSASASATDNLPTPDPSTGFRPISTDSPSWTDDDSINDDDNRDTERPTRKPTSAPTRKPTATPVPTQAPTPIPTDVPTAVPTAVPTNVPTAVPTDVPTQVPTAVPTDVPTQVPTDVPTQVPTAVPTDVPTQVPTDVPTQVPTAVPTDVPTQVPTEVPTDVPTAEPTVVPTVIPTAEPTVVPVTEAPTTAPTEIPTEEPTEVPTKEPTEEPTEVPTEEPTEEPTEVPTEEPTEEPTEAPTEEPTEEPTAEPSEPSPYTGRQYMPDVNVKYVLNDGTQIWTLLMDDNLTVAVRTYYPDGTITTYYYDATDDALYRYNGYNDGQAGVKVVGNNPAVGDEVLGGQAHVAEILEEGVLLDNGDMLITGIGIMPSETQVSDSGALTADEIAQLQNELNPQPTQEPSEETETDETAEG